MIHTPSANGFPPEQVSKVAEQQPQSKQIIGYDYPQIAP